MVLYLLVFVTAAGVVVIAVDPGAPTSCTGRRAIPKVPITNRAAVTLWVVYALTLFVAALIPLVAGPGRPEHRRADRVADDDVRRHGPRHRLQRAHEPARSRQRARRLRCSRRSAISLVPLAMIVLATELPGLQKGLLTTSLTGHEWLACFGLAALLPLVVETSKWIRRRRVPAGTVFETQRTLAPARATAGGSIEGPPAESES